MQVVHDIISYLRERGLLSSDDIQYLRQNGFLASDGQWDLDEHALYDADSEETGDAEPDDFPDQFDRPRRVRRKQGGRKPPRDEVGARTISEAILVAWDRWWPELVSLQSFAALVGPAQDCDVVLQSVRQAKPEALDGAVARILEHGNPPLGDLWRALSFDQYLDGIVPAGARGSATQAYCGITQGIRHNELGRYAYALRYEGFARLMALVQAQRAVLAAFGRCLAMHPQLFDRRLFGYRCNEICYWSLALAVSSLWGTMQASPPFRMARPSRQLADCEWSADAFGRCARCSANLFSRRCTLQVDNKAFACAAAMNSGAFTRFVTMHQSAYKADAGVRSFLFKLILDRAILCPVAWDDGYVHRQANPGDLDPGA
jgi:hypothetical protein